MMVEMENQTTIDLHHLLPELHTTLWVEQFRVVTFVEDEAAIEEVMVVIVEVVADAVGEALRTMTVIVPQPCTSIITIQIPRSSPIMFVVCPETTSDRRNIIEVVEAIEVDAVARIIARVHYRSTLNSKIVALRLAPALRQIKHTTKVVKLEVVNSHAELVTISISRTRL